MSKFILFVVVLTSCVAGAGSAQPVRVFDQNLDFTLRFDEFGDLKCEDEMARLDNFAIQLQSEPQFKGVIIFYGGQTFRGRLPKRGEAEARAARLKPYLVERRGIPAARVTVVNGGYRETWQATLWIVPSQFGTPGGYSTVPAEKIKFLKGKVNPRDYRCGI
jgi:hypothetical protein